MESNIKTKFTNQGEIMTAGKVSVTTKPDIVEIVRFYRPRGVVGARSAILSDRGVTVMFTLNYAEETFTARYSVCNGDNFSRAVGIAYAQACSHPIYGKLVRDASLYDMMIKAVATMVNYGDPEKFKKIRRDLVRLCSELSKSR